MKKIHVFVLLALAALLFSTCKKDPKVNIQDFTITKENMTVGTTTVSILGAHDWPGKIDRIRAMVSENEYHFNMEEYPAELNANNFSIVMEGLKPGTTYYYFYSVDYGAKSDFETEMKSFTTNDYSLPNVITATVSYVGPDYAVCGGEVADDGGSEVTQRGVCWAQQPNPTIQDNHTVDSCGTGVFASELKNLTVNTKYYVRAYATNEKGTAYGNDMEFTTSAQAPAVVTKEVTDIGETSARVKCEVTHDGGSAITERGVCWSKDHEPTLDDEHLANGSGLGMFICALNGLEPDVTYQVRAYAKNASGLGFGEVLTFTTNAQVQKPTVSTVEVTDVTATSATCTGNVSSDGGAEVTERGACWSTAENPTISGTHLASGSGTGSFMVNMTGLAANKTYYVRTYATNSEGTAYGEQKTFTTTEGLAVVTTGSVTEVTATSAKCGGNVTDQGASAVTERGICWSTSHSPTINDSHIAGGSGTGSFTCQMTGLTPNATYYVRAYAKNSQGVSYGSEVSFTALEGLPVVTTNDVTDITANTAKCGGNVTDQGGSNVTERGVCWSTSHNPTTTGAHANSGTGGGSYTCSMTGLAQGITYYVRAYAKNTQGISYGEEKQFTTLVNKPTVTTNSVTSITQNSATGGGNVTNDGGATVTERGICWSTSQNPTISSSHVANGTGTGSFTCQMTGLTAGTKYYVRAYATNSAGTSYGNQVDFTTTANLPTVTTAQVSNITQTTALGGGNVTSDGGADVTERGICWSTSHDPTTSGSHANSGTGTGSFTSNMTGLTANTTYYVRAYAKNSQGIAYGNEVNFTTSQNISAPTVTTSLVTNITQTTATGGGNVTDDGGANVTERGICWSTSHNPTTSGNHANSGTGTGSYTVQMSGLTANTTYYVRAYAVNSQGASYGSEVSFTTTANLPTVTTSNVSNITQTTATGGGNITSDGGASITARGICWSTSQNPTTSNSHTTDGTGTGSFTSSMTGLTANTTYYVRAYATNSAGTSYGSQVTFTTLQNVSLPTVTTSNVSNITQTTATGGGNITSHGGASITVRGICWSTSQNPTTSNSHTTDGTGTGSFTSSMTGLTANTTYYVRAYATNSVGTGYGNEVPFTTQDTYPVGAIDGLFTINANGDQVYFSKGNLQYQASTNTWRFAENQWDYVGETNSYASPSFIWWIDLFGWGTSGYNHGAVCYQPWSTSDNSADYYAYGNGNYNLYDQTGKADWGYNAISNGGNIEHQWRTLTVDEWSYLIDIRSNISGIRFAKAKVNDVNGIIIVPDDWSVSVYWLNNVNNDDAAFSTNTISISDWNTALESAGCVFLPAAGSRVSTTLYQVGTKGSYWSSSRVGYDGGKTFVFSSQQVASSVDKDRVQGQSVRLVQDYNP